MGPSSRCAWLEAVAALLAGCGSESTVVPASDSAAAVSAALPPPLSPPLSPTASLSLSASSSARPAAQVAPPSPPASDRHLSCSISGACVIDADGSVRCWGANHFGQAGIGTRGKAAVAPGTKVADLPPIRSLAVGLHHACALSRDGGIYCWGATYSGQTGDGVALPPPDAPGPSPAHPKPVRVVGLSGPAVALESGATHSCAATATGEIYCWGSNDYGELGAPGPSTSRPQVVKGVRESVEIAIGSQHTCARSSMGEVTCWGTMGMTAEPPAPVPGLCARQITAGSGFGCAIDCAGKAVCFGGGPARSGAGASLDRSLAPIPGGRVDVVEVRAGYWHVCLRDGHSELACFGGNDSGQLGSGKKADWSQDFQDQPEGVVRTWSAGAPSPQPSNGVVEVCAGGMNIRPDDRYRRPASFVDAGATCALTSAGEVYCWGEPSLSYTPVLVTHRK